MLRKFKGISKMDDFDEKHYIQMRDALDRRLPSSLANGTAIGLTISAGLYLCVIGFGAGALVLGATLMAGAILGTLGAFPITYLQAKAEVKENHYRID